jgi:glycine cleavage system pyridoxal-binding protein P
MLEEIGVSSMDQLIDETVPDEIRLKSTHMFTHKGEHIHSNDSYDQVMEHMRHLASMNKVNTDYYG